MIKYRIDERRKATVRGLKFIYRTACDADNFAQYGYDYLCCFSTIADTSLNPELRLMAHRMGCERASEWHRQNSTIPLRADALTTLTWVLAISAADRFGVCNEDLRRQVLSHFCELSVYDYIGFDPSKEAPPADVPELCLCGAGNARGRSRCRRCRRKLRMKGRYGAWLDAIIWSYAAERFDSRAGGYFFDVIKWLPAMRPYRGREAGENGDFYYTVYAITHVVYALNDYNLHCLSPKWLPDEFEFLRANLHEAIAEDDHDMMGEFLDTLRAFGVKDDHPVIRTGMDYLISSQNADGSWGDVDAQDVYNRHHPTWTAIDGLREYAWERPKLAFPELKPLLIEWAKGRN